MNQRRAEENLREQASISRAARWCRQAEQQEIELTRQQFSATIVGYDADSGVYKCRLPDGSVVEAASISPSGSRGEGSVVSLYRTQASRAIVRWL